MAACGIILFSIILMTFIVTYRTNSQSGVTSMIYLLLLPLIAVYTLLLVPALLSWFLTNRFIIKKAVSKVHLRRAVSILLLVLLMGIEIGCFIHVSANPRVVYDSAVISDETAQKISAYVQEHPETFKVEDIGWLKLSTITFMYKAEIYLVNDMPSTIGYKVQALPFGENHWTFSVQDNTITFGDINSVL